ncbi:MAG: hypothetical protein NDJ90_08690 [Oligoflexia bacterium]|nr:hypothetical protein [Oligoflexia bacterium]
MLFLPNLSAKAIPGLALLVLPLIVAPTGAAHASVSVSEREYRDALAIAQKKVERAQSAATSARVRHNARMAPGVAAPEALSSAIVIRLLGRDYRVGESWLVAATQFDPTEMRRTDDPHSLNPGKGRTGIFRYEVVAVKSSGTPEVTLRITQQQSQGFPRIDTRIEALELTFSDHSRQTRKAYRVRGREAPIPVAPEALRAQTSILEFFPLDVPEIETAEATTPRALPALPDTLARLREEAGAPVDPKRSLWFEQDDFFGRPVQVLWQKGDPWPAYLKTPGGTAILLRAEGGQS